MLFEDWQRVSPGVFERVGQQGETNTFTFEKLPGDDAEAALQGLGALPDDITEYEVAGETWWFSLTDSLFYSATTRGGSVYLITVETEDEFPVELYSFVLPLVSHNFEVTE